METHEIDMRLQRYTAAEHRIGANLQELEQHSVYQLLMTDVLTGATAKALRPVSDADPDLWHLFSLLSSALDGARRIRGNGSRLKHEDRDELARRLGTAAVLISSADIPLGERGLTGAPNREERISIEDLIDRMSRLYEPLRDVITHAEKVLREVLPRLNSAEATIGRLSKEAQALQLRAIELDRIAETIARVRDLSLTDPLSIPATAKHDLDAALHDAATVIATARTSHDELAGDIARAADVLDQCRELIARAVRNREDSLAKVASPVGLRRAPSLSAIDGDRGLAARLEPILTSTQPWQVVRRQLDEWNQSATRFRDQLARVEEANAAPLKKRDELRGRLSAFRAKMAATGRSEDLVLRDISAEAHNELFTAPSDLMRAERLVSEFGDRLASA